MSLPRGNNQIDDHSLQFVLGDLICIDMVGGVDGLSLDSIRCLSSLQVDNENQGLGIVAMPFHTLESLDQINNEEIRETFQRFIEGAAETMHSDVNSQTIYIWNDNSV